MKYNIWYRTGGTHYFNWRKVYCSQESLLKKVSILNTMGLESLVLPHGKSPKNTYLGF